MLELHHELINNLVKGTWAEKLTALTWLGGSHEKDNELVKKLMQNKKIVAEVEMLSKSDDKWTREAAKKALIEIKAKKQIPEPKNDK